MDNQFRGWAVQYGGVRRVEKETTWEFWSYDKKTLLAIFPK